MSIKNHLIQLFCNQLHESIGYTFQRELTEQKLQKLSLPKLISVLQKFQTVETQTKTLRKLAIGPQNNYGAFKEFQLQYNQLYQSLGSAMAHKGFVQWNKPLMAIKKFNKQTAQQLETL